MEWLSELVKQITISKSFTFALFIASATLLFGNIIFPTEIEPVTGTVKLALIGGFAFSGSLLIVWLSHTSLTFLSNAKRSIAMGWVGRNLSEGELALIEAAGTKANEPLNLSLADYSQMPISKLEILHIANCLREKGYVAPNHYDETIVRLTPKGRKKALELLQARK